MKLHKFLSPHLQDQFGNGERLHGATVNNKVPLVLKLPSAICYFCGTSIYDIMLTHGLGKQTPQIGFQCKWGDFSCGEQFETAGFKEKSGADFDKIMLALDGMLIWTNQLTASECEVLNIRERFFHFYRKDKLRMLLMAGCDHNCKFRFADICHPGVLSNLTAWVPSHIRLRLEDPDQTIIA
ncbi:hypothetical protein ACHAW6_010943 [Cyclotella cf. meneghiniana]